MIDLRHGDSREVLKSLAADSIDACVTDPPYALVSIVKRFGGKDAAPAQSGKSGAYARASAGFMGKQWDTGQTAFDPAFWAEVYRVLKPGAFVVAFGGTRTYHRLACAIEDAGFEIRDMMAWLYGSGFPKSHDVARGIDKRQDWSALKRLQVAIRDARKALGWSQSEAARRAGMIAEDASLGGGGYMWFETGRRLPTVAQWPALKSALGLGDELDGAFAEAERQITGTHEVWGARTNFRVTSKDGMRRDIPATAEALTWEGWGTALKPALEPVCVARKPLSEGSVAANVLRWGTGAINIRASSIDAPGGVLKMDYFETGSKRGFDGGLKGGKASPVKGQARWPANVQHDGSREVVDAFPVTGPSSGGGGVKTGVGVPGARAGGHNYEGDVGFGDEGSAARFFYSAKADAEDRMGSGHPTVKPVDLMRYYCALVTPPGGTVLDPFAGTGTTGIAATAAGFASILIERESEYVADIQRRIAWAAGQGRVTALEMAGDIDAAKASGADLPLFGGGV